MKFPAPLVEGRLLRRYKRFLADVKLSAGETVIALCANTGSMMGCVDAGNRVWLSPATGATRKLAWTWEIVEINGGTLVGINTHRPNHLVREAIERGHIPELAGYERITPEVRYGAESSRIDWLLETKRRPACYLEVKNVTAAVSDKVALFPDAVSDRGAKHLREMMAVVRNGQRAVLCFCVQRGDVKEVRPADQIDPVYGRTLRQAIDCGVEVIAYRAQVTPSEIHLRYPLPVVCP